MKSISSASRLPELLLLKAVISYEPHDKFTRWSCIFNMIANRIWHQTVLFGNYNNNICLDTFMVWQNETILVSEVLCYFPLYLLIVPLPVEQG